LFDPFSAAIHSVSVASHQADFVHHDPLAQINISNPQDCHTYPELKRKIYSALAEGDEGELSIAIPKEVSLRQTGHANHSIVNGRASEGNFIVARLYSVLKLFTKSRDA
jgi:transcription initiation factor TFIID subunit 2